MNPIVATVFINTEKSNVPPSDCKITSGYPWACKFSDFLAVRCVSVLDCLLLLLHINHVNNSNSADSGQSSFLLHRETVTAVTRKTQAALMMAWALKGAQLFLFIIITSKTQLLCLGVRLTETHKLGACMALGTHNTHKHTLMHAPHMLKHTPTSTHIYQV